MGKVSAPLLTSTRKALQINAFFWPKALHIRPMSAHSVTGLTPPLLFSTFRTVFRPVGFWHKVAAADGTGLHAVTVEQSSAQASVQRQDGGTKPFADQRVGDTLRADTFLTIVQKQAAPAVIIAAAMYQSPGCAVLLIIHVDDHGSSSVAGSLM
jgi:hypothetical protein